MSTLDYLLKAYNSLPEEDREFAEGQREDFGQKAQDAWDNRVED